MPRPLGPDATVAELDAEHLTIEKEHGARSLVLGRVASLSCTESGAARAPEARRDARLVVVAVWMQQRRLGENPRAAPAAGPELREPLDTRGNRALRADDAPDALARHRRLEVTPAQRLDERERPDARRVPVAAQCLEVDPRAELVHLRVAHAGPDVATRDRETLEPSVVQHLRSVGEEPVDGHILDARRMPQEPRDG